MAFFYVFQIKPPLKLIHDSHAYPDGFLGSYDLPHAHFSGGTRPTERDQRQQLARECRSLSGNL